MEEHQSSEKCLKNFEIIILFCGQIANDMPSHSAEATQSFLEALSDAFAKYLSEPNLLFTNTDGERVPIFYPALRIWRDSKRISNTELPEKAKSWFHSASHETRSWIVLPSIQIGNDESFRTWNTSERARIMILGEPSLKVNLEVSPWKWLDWLQIKDGINGAFGEDLKHSGAIMIWEGLNGYPRCTP